MQFLVAILSLLTVLIYCTSGFRDGPYAHLLADIRDRTSEDAIPVIGRDQPVDVNMTVTPIDIKNVDTDSKETSIEVWLTLKWNSGVSWYPDQFEGVDEMAVPSDYIWMPDISVFNGLQKLVDQAPNGVLMSSDGLVKWVPRFTLRAQCDIKEDQLVSNATCTVKLGSWFYGDAVLNFVELAEKGVDMDYYFAGSRYEILASSTAKHTIFYDCCPDLPYSHIAFTYSFKLRDGN